MPPPSGSSAAAGKPFSISLGGKPRPASGAASKSNGLPAPPKKRVRSALADDDDDHEDDGAGGQPQLLTGFDKSAGGAISIGEPKEEKAPLVISGEKNKDWRKEASRRSGKGGKNLLPEEERARREGRAAESQDAAEVEEAPVYGLVLGKKQDEDSAPGSPSTIGGAEPGEAPKPKTMDQQALERLLGEDPSKTSTMVIPAAETADEDRFAPRATEESAFRADVASRPDAASLDDYAAVPIEEFGRALLRGMGWKEGDEIGRKIKTPVANGKAGKDKVKQPWDIQKRPNLLGLGAKEVPDGMEEAEMGAWGLGAKGKKKTGGKIDRNYTVLALKNKETGEVLTEEELTKRQANEKFIPDEGGARDSDRRRDRDRDKERDRRRDKDRDRDRDYESSRHSSSRRDKDRDRDRERDRDRDRYRDKDRDRERRHRDGDDYKSDRKRKDKYDERDDSHRSERKRREKYDDYDDDQERKKSSKHRDRNRDRDRSRDRDRRRH